MYVKKFQFVLQMMKNLVKFLIVFGLLGLVDTPEWMELEVKEQLSVESEGYDDARLRTRAEGGRLEKLVGSHIKKQV